MTTPVAHTLRSPFCSNSRFLAASSRWALIIANLARSALASSVLPAAVNA